MIFRKKGETHRDFIKRLETENSRLYELISSLKLSLDQTIQKNDVIPLSHFLELNKKYGLLKEQLKSYNLYTGRE